MTLSAPCAQGAGRSARSFVVCDAARVIAYYSLTVGQIDTLDAPERVRRGMGQYLIPVMILARLAVDKAWHGQGLGAGLLQDAIRRTIGVAAQAGIRALLTYPLDDAAEGFYRRFGFEPTLMRGGFSEQFATFSANGISAEYGVARHRLNLEAVGTHIDQKSINFKSKRFLRKIQPIDFIEKFEILDNPNY